jgi:hypothetical protein
MAVGKNLATSLKASLIWFKEARKKMWMTLSLPNMNERHENA